MFDGGHTPLWNASIVAVMLHEFLSAHRSELIDRCTAKVAKRPSPIAMQGTLEHGIPLFLDQLIKTLHLEQSADATQSRTISGPPGGEQDGAPDGTQRPPSSEIRVTATLHGRELLQRGFTVDQVVHDYGDLCQSITDLACEQHVQIEADEFRTLNRCLDNGIAGAVTEFTLKRDYALESSGIHQMNERLGFLAHELRNHINTASLAVSVIKGGSVGISGATGDVLERSLIGLRNLVDRSLAEVRTTAGLSARHEVIALPELIAKIQITAQIDAVARDCELIVANVPADLEVDADRDMLLSAIGSLLQNAFKFTNPNTEVSLTVHAQSDRILIDIEDHCGGLPPSPEKLFLPFSQGRDGQAASGLGLAICRRSVEANNGMLRVRDVPGSGCVFTIDLPRVYPQAPSGTATEVV